MITDLSEEVVSVPQKDAAGKAFRIDRECAHLLGIVREWISFSDEEKLALAEEVSLCLERVYVRIKNGVPYQKLSATQWEMLLRAIGKSKPIPSQEGCWGAMRQKAEESDIFDSTDAFCVSPLMGMGGGLISLGWIHGERAPYLIEASGVEWESVRRSSFVFLKEALRGLYIFAGIAGVAAFLALSYFQGMFTGAIAGAAFAGTLATAFWARIRSLRKKVRAAPSPFVSSS